MSKIADNEGDFLSIQAGLRIDPAVEAGKIERLVQAEVDRLGARGVVLGLSGGLDSSVCASLCVRALGRERVHTFTLPERDSDPQNVADAASVAQALGLEPTTIDLTPVLELLGVYRIASQETAGDRKMLERWLHRASRLLGSPSAFGEGLAFFYEDQPGLRLRLERRYLWRFMGAVQAFVSTKVTLRMLVLYHQAALNHCLVAGTSDKSEWSVGYFVKYGDGAQDVALLRHLYKTQIRQLAEWLELPEGIIRKPSSGDFAAGLPNEAVIGLSYERLDGILWGLEHGLPEAEICAQLGARAGEIRAVRSAMHAAQVRRALPREVGTR